MMLVSTWFFQNPVVKHVICTLMMKKFPLQLATDTDDGEYDSDAASAYQYISIDGQTQSDECALGNAIYLDYLVAKRRWRRFGGRPPRRYRRFSHRHDVRQRHCNRLASSPYASSFASFLPSNAFAGGQGKGKGKDKGKHARKNPRGKDGKVLLCATCGSDSHLWRQCPKGKGQSGPHSSSPPSMAMLTNVLPGVSFNYMTGNVEGNNPNARTVEEYNIATRSNTNSLKSSAGYDFELESLRSVTSESSRGLQPAQNELHRQSKRSREHVHVVEETVETDGGRISPSRRSSNAKREKSQSVTTPLVDAFMQGRSESSMFGLETSSQSSSMSSNRFPLMFAQGGLNLFDSQTRQVSSLASMQFPVEGSQVDATASVLSAAGSAHPNMSTEVELSRPMSSGLSQSVSASESNPKESRSIVLAVHDSWVSSRSSA